MLLRCFIAVLLLTAPIALLAQPAPGQLQSLAELHRAKGLACASCHHETPAKTAVPDQVCIACHGGVAAIIARANDYDPNPHVSPHSAELQCSTCHHAHKPAAISCLACHADKTFVRQSSRP